MELDPQSSAPHRVEAYLDQVLAPLTRNLSAFQVGELRRELKAHLWERIDAYNELGHSEDAAVTEALKQFGGADDFVKQWRAEWLTFDKQGAVRDLWTATQSALRLSVPLLVASWGLARFGGWFVINCVPSTYWGALGIVYSEVLFEAAGAGFFGLSLWAGFFFGRRSQRRSGLGMFAALSLIVAGGSGLFEVSAATGLDHTILGGLFTSLPLMAAVWMPTACVAAAVSGWQTQRKRVPA